MTQNFAISEVVFQSPRTAAESPEMLGNITDNPSPGTAAEAPEMLGNIMDDPSPKTAAEAPEMPADIGDDLTDSQFCAMDWSSQFQQESGYTLKSPNFWDTWKNCCNHSKFEQGGSTIE